MRLLVLSTWLPYPPDNGSRQRAYHLLRQLARRNEVTLLSFGVARTPDDEEALRAMCGRVELVPPAQPGGRRLAWRGLLSPVPRYVMQTESARMKALVAARVLQHDAALALQLDAARYLSAWPQVPRVFEEVEVGLYLDALSRGASALDRWRHRLTWWKHRRFVRGLVNSFDRSTVVSATERSHLLEIGCDPDRIDVVPNGANAAVDLPARSQRAPRLIYPGSVTYSANLDAVRYFVRDVLPLVRRARPDVTFVVTGPTDGADIAGLQSEAGVTFTGLVPDVAPLIAESAACVVPLRIGGGSRLKVLQALALGTPVVSTRKGVEGLDVEPGRHALVADGSEPFAEHVLRVMGDPVLAGDLSRHGHALVCQRYGWEAIGRSLERVIGSAVAHHASARVAPRPV